MANWAEGEIGLRGAVQSIREFLLNAFEFNGAECLKVTNTEIEISNMTFVLREFERSVIKRDIIKVNLKEELCDEEGKVAIFFPIACAWSLNLNDLITLSKRYNLNVWIQVFEKEVGFREEACVVAGEIVYYDHISWDSYCGSW